MQCHLCGATKEGAIDDLLAWSRAHRGECAELQLRAQMRALLNETLEESVSPDHETSDELAADLVAALRKRGLVIVQESSDELDGS